MKTVWTDKKVFFLKIIPIVVVIISISICCFLFLLYVGIKSLNEPREISLAHNLPNSAIDVNEKTDYLQAAPDEEYRYYLKAKITKDEFLEFVDDLKLEWASPIHRSYIPLRNPQIPWWDPSSGSFLYATGNNMDYCMQADYIESTGYMYLYLEQN
jgi:hypothetical protein